MRRNYEIENYCKCEKCKHFAQHYNIDYNYIYKVKCGHCYKYGKDINPKRTPCPYFEQNRGQRTKVKKRNIVHLLESLHLDIEFIKLFLNKNKPKQKISDIMIDKLTKQT